MENLSMVWAVGAPFAPVMCGILGGVLITANYRRDMKKRQAKKEYLERVRQQARLHQEAGQRVVNSVNSNNNSPRLGENLSMLFSRLEQLGIELNVNVNGCVENARR